MTTKLITLRVDPEEHAAWTARAEADGIPFAAWSRRCMNAALNPAPAAPADAPAPTPRRPKRSGNRCDKCTRLDLDLPDCRFCASAVHA